MAASSSKAPPEKEDTPRLQPLLFEALKSDGSNYTRWNVMAEMHLEADGAEGAIAMPTPDEVTPAAKAWAALLLRRHLDVSLQDQYLQEKNPATIWSTLKARFSQERRLHLPEARYAWINLRVMDFPNLTSYNNELHRIVSQL